MNKVTENMNKKYRLTWKTRWGELVFRDCDGEVEMLKTAEKLLHGDYGIEEVECEEMT